jgi:hypothetical protein
VSDHRDPVAPTNAAARQRIRLPEYALVQFRAGASPSRVHERHVIGPDQGVPSEYVTERDSGAG